MRLTDFTDYGLRALMRLAGQPDRLFTTDEIASEFKLSRNHLTKIVQTLAATGFVVTQRGAGGGFRLARPADTIKLGDLIRILEERHALVECFQAAGGNCLLTPRCRLKSKLAVARDAFYRELDGWSLADCAYPPPRGAAATSPIA